MLPGMNHLRLLALIAWLGLLPAGFSQVNPPLPQFGPVGEIVKVHTGFTFTEGPAADRSGNLYFTDVPANRIHRLDLNGTLSTVWAESQRCNGLMVGGSGKLIACQGGAGRVISLDVRTKAVTVLADQFAGKPFNAPNDLVIDRHGGIYFTDPQFGQQPNHQGTYAVYYIDPKKNHVTRVLTDQPKPNGILLSPDERMLYVLPSTADHLLRWPVKQPGQLGAGGNWCPLAKNATGQSGGGDGLTIDTQGNLYLTIPSQKLVQIVSPQGETLALLTFPEGPTNCAFGGQDMRTLYVTAQTSLYAVRMKIKGHRFPAGKR